MKDESFGEHLRKERVKRGLTAETLAASCGISRSYVTLIENGRRLPGKKHILKIAAALGIQSGTVLNWYLEDMSRKIRSHLEQA